MKKLFTLLMVLAVASVGYAQVRSMSKNDLGKVAKQRVALRNDGNEALVNVQSQPNMTRTNGELDYTFYDWQTNCASRTWTKVWDDGKINFAFTTASDAAYSDRGTAIGTYDSNNDEWIPLGGRIENERTGFGTIAQYGANGLVVAAHTSSECGVYIVEDKDNMTPESAITLEKLDPTNDPCWPNVMTSGANRDIIHVVATASVNNLDGMEDVNQPIIYFRSTDGGETWDKENVVLPFMGPEYGLDWGSNVCYWMETTEDNCLALVVNNAWSDGMVLYSYDDGETWDRIVFYKHPGIDANFTDMYLMYPRWVSAQWDQGHNLHIAYEFNATTGEPGSGSYYPGLGGVAYWNENLPYHGCDTCPYPYGNPHVVGEPFVMDTVYIFEDIYASWGFWADASHESWPEYIGPLVSLTDAGDPEDPWHDEITAFNLASSDARGQHGAYNCGVCANPVLCRVPNSDDFVAVWSMMDENHQDENDNYYFKLYARFSGDGGFTWSPMKALTKATLFRTAEMVYCQAAVVGHTLVVACQSDQTAGTYVQGDDAAGDDNFYQGLTFNLDELFDNVSVPEIANETKMTICPNPAVDNLDVTLSSNAEIVIYNIMGQVVANQMGHAGLNTVRVSNLSSGVYFINAGNDTQKFVVK